MHKLDRYVHSLLTMTIGVADNLTQFLIARFQKLCNVWKRL